VAGALIACADIRAQLYVALDAGHLSQQRFDRLYRLSHDLSEGLHSLHNAYKQD